MEENIEDKIGEEFALKYLTELFKKNNVNMEVRKTKNADNQDVLEVSGNGKRYLIKVKYSANPEHPDFRNIHFKEEYDYLLLIWHPSKKEFKFSLLTKDEARRYATPM